MNSRRKRGYARRSRKILGRALLAFFACGVLSIAGCGAYRRARDWSVFSVRHIAVRGVAAELIPDVIEASAVEIGTSMLELDRQLISRRLRSLDFVRDVRIGRRPTGSVVIDIKKREPFALVNGKVFVGRDGIEVRADTHDLDIPEITSRLQEYGGGRNRVDPDLLGQAVEVLARAGELGPARVDISRPEDMLVVLDDGTYIHLGAGEFREKLSMVSLVLADVRESGKKPRQVDARFSRQILVRN